MEMDMEGEVVQRNQPRRKKNRADLADELEFFMELRDTLKKKKEKGMTEKERFDSSNSYRSLDTQKRLGFVDNHIKILRKRLGITGTAHGSPAISDPTDPLEKHVNDLSDLSSTLEPDPISDDDDDADGCGDEEEEDEMDWGQSAMEEQVPRIDSKLKSEIEAEAVMEADVGANEASILKSETLVLKPDPIPTNIMAKVDGDDSIRSAVMPRDDDDHDADGVDDEIDRGKTAEQLAREAKVMAVEEERIASFRSGWESAWSQRRSYFPDMTAVGSMQFTHLAPGRIPYGAGIESALQIFSFKLAEIKGGFTFPLSVYGVVAARDAVDRNRNLLFSCARSKSQTLTEGDPFLRLIGPSRAILFDDNVDFEVQLRVKGSTKSRDRPLITDTCHYTRGRLGVSTICFKNCFCATELRLEQLLGSVQATIFGVRAVKDGSWPFGHGVRVACSPVSRRVVTTDTEIKYIANPPSGEILLLDSKDGTRPEDGYLHLSRQVVSVEPEGQLEVEIQAYAPPGGTAAKGQVCFEAQQCNVSQVRCHLDGAEVEITVAWSLLVSNRRGIAAKGWDFERGDDTECAFRQVGLNGEAGTERIF